MFGHQREPNTNHHHHHHQKYFININTLSKELKKKKENKGYVRKLRNQEHKDWLVNQY